MVAEGKTIYGIGLNFEHSITLQKAPALFNYFKDLGFDRILPWSPEIEQKIGHLLFAQGMYQDATGYVKEFLEKHPE